MIGNTLRGILSSATQVTHVVPGGAAYTIRQLAARSVNGLWAAADPTITTTDLGPFSGKTFIPLGTPVHFELDGNFAINVRKI